MSKIVFFGLPEVFCGLKYVKMRFWPGLRPRPCWGSSQRCADHYSRLGRGHPSPDSTHLALPFNWDGCAAGLDRFIDCDSRWLSLYYWTFDCVDRTRSTQLGLTNCNFLIRMLYKNTYEQWRIQDFCEGDAAGVWPPIFSEGMTPTFYNRLL